MFRKTLGFYILFLITGIILAVYPAIDIWFSNLFYQGEKQFFVKHYLVGENYYYEFIIRRFALPLMVILLLFFPVVAKLFLSLKFKIRLFNIKTQDIFYIWLSAFFINLFINSVLKEGWGRSRPNDIINFGGSNNFTSWIQYSLECTSNCSFVSGDAAVGFFIVVYYYLTKNIVEIADTHCQGRIISFLEGGYDLTALSESIKEHLRGL